MLPHARSSPHRALVAAAARPRRRCSSLPPPAVGARSLLADRAARARGSGRALCRLRAHGARCSRGVAARSARCCGCSYLRWVAGRLSPPRRSPACCRRDACSGSLVAPLWLARPLAARSAARCCAVVGLVVLVPRGSRSSSCSARSPWLAARARWRSCGSPTPPPTSPAARSAAASSRPRSARQDVGGRLGALARRGAVRAGARAVRRARRRYAGDRRRRAHRGSSSSSCVLAAVSHRRRPLRVVDEAPGGRQGQRHAAARPRRHPRSHRRARSPTLPLAALAAMLFAARTPPMRRLTLLGSTGLDRRSHARRRRAPSRPLRGRRAHRARDWRHAAARSARASGPRYAVLADAGRGARSRAGAARARPARPRCVAAPRRSSASRALPEVDTVMAAIVGAAGLRADARRGARRQARAARQQGSAGDGRRAVHARRARGRRDAAADRQRAQRDLPVPAARATRGELGAAGVRRILLTASGGPFRATPLERARARHAGRRPARIRTG